MIYSCFSSLLLCDVSERKKRFNHNFNIDPLFLVGFNFDRNVWSLYASQWRKDVGDKLFCLHVRTVPFWLYSFQPSSSFRNFLCPLIFRQDVDSAFWVFHDYSFCWLESKIWFIGLFFLCRSSGRLGWFQAFLFGSIGMQRGALLVVRFGVFRLVGWLAE